MIKSKDLNQGREDGVLRMDEINKIKKDFTNGDSRNQIAKKFNRSWNTVDTIIKTSREDLTERGKRRKREATVATDEVRLAIDELLEKERTLKVKRKQRYTAAFIFKELKRTGIYTGTERTLRALVARIRTERKQKKIETKSFLPLSFEPGSCIQVDHGEADCVIGETRFTAYLFVGSLPGLAIRYCQIYPVKAQESWGDFHEKAFRFFDGIFPSVTYDNDSVLIKKILGTDRDQTDFSTGLEEHYGFDSVFCNPGSGNEKGAVENAVGYCRRNYLAGLPEYKDWATVNEHLEKHCLEAIEEGSHYRSQEKLKTLLTNAQKNTSGLLPGKNWCKWSSVTVNSSQLVACEKHQYSVPERYVGAKVQVAAEAFNVKIYYENELIAAHPRHFEEGEDSLHLDHYLDQLSHKAGALWDCSAVKKHKFEPELTALWNRLKSRLDRREANKEFIEILLLKRLYDTDAYKSAIELALEFGAIEHAGVLNILKQLTSDRTEMGNESWLIEIRPELKGKMFNASFDLSQYGDLCKEVSNAQ
jgi:transposase